jgi:hypothetical protein
MNRPVKRAQILTGAVLLGVVVAVPVALATTDVGPKATASAGATKRLENLQQQAPSYRTLSVNPWEGQYWGHSDDHTHYLHFSYIGTLESGTIHQIVFQPGHSFFDRVEVRNGEFDHAQFGRAITGHWCNSHHLKGTFHAADGSTIHWHASYPNARDYPAPDPNEGPTSRCS